jgi:hypothetical protein
MSDTAAPVLNSIRGDEFLVNTTTRSDQQYPVITSLRDGGFVATWQDGSGQGGDSSSTSIKAQMFDASGAKVGNEFLVNTNWLGGQYSPTISGLTNGGFVVTWQDGSGQGGDASGTSIKAQMFDASGAKVGNEFLVNTTTAYDQVGPAITSLSDGRFVITWRDLSGSQGDYAGGDIKAQVFDATGAKIGGEFLVNTTTVGQQFDPQITSLSNGGFVIAWSDASGLGGDNSDSSIKAQLFDATGAKVGNELLVNTATTSTQWASSITGLIDGGFVVAWQDYSGEGGDSSGSSIKAQIFGMNDNAPVITTAETQSVAENTKVVAALTSTDVDTVGINPAIFTISGGTDAALFEVVGGDLVFKTAPDYETDPHSYEVY